MVGDDDVKRVVQAALDRVGPDPTPTRARLLAALAAAHDASSEWQTRRDLSIQALDDARHSGDDAAVVQVIDTTLAAVATPDRLGDTIADLEQAVAIADRIADPVLQARTRYQLVWARYQESDIAGSNRLCAEMEAITERVGLPQLRWHAALALTGQLLLAGHADDAEAANELAFDLGTAAGRPEAPGVFGGNLYVIRFHQGRLDEIADFFLDVARDNPSIAALRAAIPAMLCEVGRIDEATEYLAVEAAAEFEFPYDSTWLNIMRDVLDAVVTTENRRAARALVDRVEPFAAHVVAPSSTIVQGAIARPLARAATLLGDYDQAEEWFAIAHDIHTRLQAPFWTALGQLDHADLCLARRADDDLDRARQLVTTAAATAAEYGCAGLTRRAEAILADL